MKPINNYDKVLAMTERVKLPAGGYEAKIIGAKVTTYTGKSGDFEKLEIAVDITAGDFTDYYKHDFDTNTADNKKWKGVCRLYVPTQDGSDSDMLTLRILKGSIDAIEDSNPGYHWDWNETALKGKKVGILVRDKEWSYNGKTGFAPEIVRLISIDAVKAGNFKVPAPKLLNGSTAAVPAANQTIDTEVSDDKYPF